MTSQTLKESTDIFIKSVSEHYKIEPNHPLLKLLCLAMYEQLVEEMKTKDMNPYKTTSLDPNQGTFVAGAKPLID